jgi:hypothetical protein
MEWKKNNISNLYYASGQHKIKEGRIEAKSNDKTNIYSTLKLTLYANKGL